VQVCLDDPGVTTLLAGGTASGATTRPRRVLFVCTHNSARSQLAAAAWQRVSQLPAASAGTHPAPRVHPRAVAVGRRHGLRLTASRTSSLTDVATADDLIVCVCDNAHEELTAHAAPVGDRAVGDIQLVGDIPLVGDIQLVGNIHWSVPDPVRVDTDDAFETAYAELAGRVERLARTLDGHPAADS
jgi:protein-tyrosine-phosphatase